MDARARLVKQLQLAHAGEKAAAIAYSGHWRSVRDGGQRANIKKIEDEEWDHRRRLNRMLRELQAGPAGLRELWMAVIGRVIYVICFVSGWFIPMYGAGKIERRNVHEYVDAARFARDAGHPELIDELMGMAEVEWDHEQYFRGLLAGHWLLRVLPLWPALPPRESLRLDAASADA